MLKLLLVSLAIPVWSEPPSITKVEPPDWWAAHTINPVRLLLHGAGLQGATVSAPAGLSISDVRSNERGTYLFASLTIPPSTRPGTYVLLVHAAEGEAKVPFRVNAALQPSARLPGFSPADVVYEIMPDRFANGDPGNDGPPALLDRNNASAYHGGDFKGIIDHLAYVEDLGATAIWMTPIYDNSDEITRAQGGAMTDYHGYGATDFYGVEEHFGDLKTLRELVARAHSMGMKVIQDQVANHCGPHHPWVNDPPTPTWFHGTLEHHLNETWNGWALPDPNSEPLKRAVLEGWFGDTLPDLNQDDPELRIYEIQNTLWWLGEVGFDAVRQDTFQYVSRDFWRDWMLAIKRQFPTVNVVGEVLQPDPVLVSFFQGGKVQQGVDTHLDSLFDYPLYFALRGVFTEGKALSDVPATLSHDDLYSNANVLWTFIGDHDEPRLMNFARVDLASAKLAATCVFTVRGVPFIYSGDELGLRGGDDPDNRRDFPGGWPGDEHSAFLHRTADEETMFQHLRKLAHVRRTVSALARGVTKNLLVSDRQWAFERIAGDSDVLVVINQSDKPATLSLAVDGTAWHGLLGYAETLSLTNGTLSVTLPAKSGEILSR
jgi:neopullulanase